MTLIAAAVIAVGVWSTGIAAAVTIAKPTLLVATATSSTTVSLSWHDASNNEIGFEIQRSPAKKTAWKKIATRADERVQLRRRHRAHRGNRVQVPDPRLKPGSGASSFSNTATVTTLGGTPPGDTTAPTTPGGSSVSATSCSATLLSWLSSTDTGGSGLKDYAIWRDGVVVKYVTGLTTTDTGLTVSHTYSYAVQARNNANNVSGKSAAKSVTTAACPVGPIIPAPQQFNVTADSCAFAFATWNTIYDPNNAYHVTKYNVYRNNVLVKTVPAPGTAPTASTVDTPLVALMSYSYAVTAADAAGHESAKSTSVSVTTSACEPGVRVGPHERRRRE